LGKESYDASVWVLFINCSKRSLKAVLLHNGNNVASIPIAHSIHLNETYENLRIVLEKINWNLCGNMKILQCYWGNKQHTQSFHVSYVNGWQSKGHTLDKKKYLPRRKDLIPGSKTIVHASLVDMQKNLLPPLHIKLGIMKQFVKALDRSGLCFQYLSNKFLDLSDAKVKEGIFDGPQIPKLLKDATFINTMNGIECQASNVRHGMHS
jgi:hypothetical protein